ncbi:MAG TPA: hypothetical protein VK479_16195 [Micropepsaceae bacterium]|nr:hypothetical protein [Micropepsaceae bacterium]
MDLMLLRVFQRQVDLECRFLLLAAEEVDQGLRGQNVYRTFYGLQNLLNAGANISKALWGPGGKFAGARKPLRDSIGISDDSPLRHVGMRNNFEHVDERIDEWWQKSKGHNHVDLNIGPKKGMFGGLEEIDQFRLFDPDTTDITFWGQEFNLRKIVDEVRSIAPKLAQEANKPHW